MAKSKNEAYIAEGKRRMHIRKKNRLKKFTQNRKDKACRTGYCPHCGAPLGRGCGWEDY